jgi:hypothetical protein
MVHARRTQLENLQDQTTLQPMLANLLGQMEIADLSRGYRTVQSAINVVRGKDEIMVTRCDIKDCFEKAPHSLSVYGNAKPGEDTDEIWSFDLCTKHYRRMLGRMTISVNGT